MSVCLDFRDKVYGRKSDVQLFQINSLCKLQTEIENDVPNITNNKVSWKSQTIPSLFRSKEPNVLFQVRLMRPILKTLGT